MKLASIIDTNRGVSWKDGISRGVNSRPSGVKKNVGVEMTDVVQINTLDEELEWEEWKGVCY